MSQQVKDRLAEKVLKFIPTQGIIGLGAGSTVNTIIGKLDEKFKIKAVSSSSSTSLKLSEGNIEEININSLGNSKIPILIDGADFIDLESEIILKGGGGALTMEKICWEMAEKVIVVADYSKLKKRSKLIIPIEIIPNSYSLLKSRLKEPMDEIQLSFMLRLVPPIDMPFITDNGNWVLDLIISIQDSAYTLIDLNEKLITIPGVVETGIFHSSLFKKTRIIIGYEDSVKEV